MHVLDPIPVELVKVQRPTQPDHTHTCSDCGFVWGCSEFAEADCRRVGVFRAAAVNGEGPHCYMCMYIEMAKRHANARGLVLTVSIQQANNPS